MSDVKIQLLTPEWCDRWNAFVDQHGCGWFWQRTEWLDYLTVYYPGTKALSFMLIEGERVKAVCPLLFERGQFGGGGIPLPRPLFDSLIIIPEDSIATYLGEYLATAGGFRSCPLVETKKPSALIFPWGTSLKTYHSRVVDLTPSVDDLLKGLRKSYRYLINSDVPYSGVAVGLFPGKWSEQSDDLFARYQAAHQDKLQPERQLQTYDHQRNWLREGKAVLIASRLGSEQSNNGHPLPIFQPNAFQYFILYKHKAYYASGVGDSLIRPMWQAMTILKDIGIQELEIGWTDYGTTEKEKNIEFFKKGFGGEDRPWWVMSYG